MNKFMTLSAGFLVALSTSAVANTGLENAVNLQVERANEEIQVINDFKTCVQSAGDAADIKSCHAVKKLAMKALWTERSKK